MYLFVNTPKFEFAMFNSCRNLLYILIHLITLCYCKKYSNYTLYRAMPVDDNHLKFLANLSDMYEVNFWRPPGLLHKPVDFIISPGDEQKFLQEIDKRKIYLTTIMPNVQLAFDKQTVMTYIRRNLNSFNWLSYFRLKDIYSWLKDLKEAYPDEIKLLNMGKTTEGRMILAVKIVLNGCKSRSNVIVEGGIHGREWISPAFVTYMIHETITAPKSTNKEWKKIAHTHEWIFMPVVNPDGYEYSHTNDRLWRKNRASPSGVDLNRNFDIAFAKVGVSKKYDSNTYCGPHAFSELETVAMSKLITANSKNLEYYVGFHSYGQYIIIPYAHTKKHIQNFNEVKDLGDKVARSISKMYSTRYTVGNAYDTVGYKVSGNSGGWVKKNFKVPYVVTFELRDDGENGFALPPKDILPTCQETMDGMITFLNPQSRTTDTLKYKLEPDGQKAIYLDTIVITSTSCYCKTYSNYTFYRALPVAENHLEFFANLSDLYDVNFWRLPGLLHKPIDFIISPSDQQNFLQEIDKRKIYLTTIMPNVQLAFDKQLVMTYIRRNLKSFNWQSYFRLNDIYSWLKDLKKTYPDEIRLLNMGKTSEGRKMFAVRVALNGCKFRSKVIVEGGIHAREWISPAFVTYMIHETITAPKSTNEEWKKIAHTYEWIFMPVVNPDGYEYSHTNDRLWRKNRAGLDGVDLNRNFDIAFAKIGVSKRYGSNTYCGPRAFSELETVAMSKLITANSNKLEYYFGFHSYGQYMIIPYAYTKKHFQNFNEVQNLAQKAARSISQKYSTRYAVGTAYDTVGYETSGVSGCWVKKNFGVPYVVTFELRDNGDKGFALPPSDILPTCQETMDGMITLLTPQSQTYNKLQFKPEPDGQKAIFLDTVVIICEMNAKRFVELKN